MERVKEIPNLQHFDSFGIHNEIHVIHATTNFAFKGFTIQETHQKKVGRKKFPREFLVVSYC